MNVEELSKKIKNGEYTIEHDGTCCCQVDSIDENSNVILSSDDCWQTNTLIVDGVEIARYAQYDTLKLLIDNDLSDDVEDLIRELLYIDEDEDNHDYEALLLDYFEQFPDAKFYRDDLRGFSNEYTIGVDYNGTCENINEYYKEITKEEAAEGIAYRGDVATRPYNSYVEF